MFCTDRTHESNPIFCLTLPVLQPLSDLSGVPTQCKQTTTYSCTYIPQGSGDIIEWYFDEYLIIKPSACPYACRNKEITCNRLACVYVWNGCQQTAVAHVLHSQKVTVTPFSSLSLVIVRWFKVRALKD